MPISHTNILLILFRLPAEEILRAINLLAQIPCNPIFNMQEQKLFVPKELLPALKKGLGGPTAVGADSTDFGAGSTKNYFFMQLRSREEGRKTYLYVDKSPGIKMVQLMAAEEFHRRAINQDAYLPLEIHEITNPWYAPETEQVFCPLDWETAREAVKNQMELLRAAANCEKKMKLLIDELEDDSRILSEEFQNGELSDDGRKWERFPVRISADDIARLVYYTQKVSLYIAKALELALAVDGSLGPILWKEKCKAAIKTMNNAGVTLWKDKSGAPILEWFAVFRKRRMFPNPLLESSRYGPPFLVNQPLVVKRLREFGDSNLENLKIDLMRDRILNHCLPSLVEARRKRILDSYPDAEAARSLITKESILAIYGLKTLCRKTVHNWMVYMGYR
jgi:hypothetical protein